MSFDEFWKQYPRKIAKRVAEKSWLRLKKEEQDAALEALQTHLEYWRKAGTEKEYIPHPSTWLNQARWEDEIEMPVDKPVDNTIKQWWASEKTILEMGKRVGLQPLGGEDWSRYKQRINEKLRVA